MIKWKKQKRMQLYDIKSPTYGSLCARVRKSDKGCTRIKNEKGAQKNVVVLET